MLFAKFRSQYIGVSRLKAYFTANSLLSGGYTGANKKQRISTAVDIRALRVKQFTLASITHDRIAHYMDFSVYILRIFSCFKIIRSDFLLGRFCGYIFYILVNHIFLFRDAEIDCYFASRFF